FLWQRRLSWRLAPALALLFVLGGLQGALGWWMVTSGLAGRIDVSQYRLAAHLAAACILFLALIFVARRIRPPRAGGATAKMRRAWPVGIFAALVFVQIVAGAFVAGLDAGLAYNNWPLMDGALVPDGLFVLSPWWVNFFENAATVQLTHRLLAYVIVFAAFWLAIASFRRTAWRGHHVWAPVIVALTLVQAALGIATLVLAVPIGLALAHQGTAFLLAGASICWLEDLTRPTGSPIPPAQDLEIAARSNVA
ncbi:MAG: COX15/CtaA family protein, partial [Cucumibacter sp.]